MSNTNRGEVRLKLDRERLLRYDMNALAEFEDAMGHSMLYAVQSMQDADGNPDISFKLVRGLVWAGLLHENPDLKIRDAGNLFDEADGDTLPEKLGNVFSAVMEAILDRFGDEEAKKKVRDARESLKKPIG